MKKSLQSIVAAFSVALVVITMGAAFGVLSERGAFIGIVSTAVVTFVTAIVGGTKYGVTAPTGPMTAAIAVILASNSDILGKTSQINEIELLSITIFAAAIFVLLLTLLRVQKLISFIPQLVISGFVNGIAVLIAVSQIKAIHTQTDLWVAFSSLVILLIAGYFIHSKAHPAIKLVGSSFAVIVLMSILVAIFKIPATSLGVNSTFADLSFTLPSLASIDSSVIKFAVKLGFELAVIAILDTLLTSVIMDKKTKVESNHTKELVGQSLSLLTTSFFGGIPGAQSTAPSVMLHQEGGTHKYTKMYLALFCIVIMLLSPYVLPFLPSAVFAGIILKVAIDIADLTAFKTILTKRKKHWLTQLFILVGTILSTVLISLNMAVIFFTAFFIIYNKFFPTKHAIPDLVEFKEQEGLIDEI